MADFFCAKYGLFVFNFFIAVSTFTSIVIVDILPMNFSMISLVNWSGNFARRRLDATYVHRLFQFCWRNMVFGSHIDDSHRRHYFRCCVLGMLRSFAGKCMHDSQCKRLKFV